MILAITPRSIYVYFWCVCLAISQINCYFAVRKLRFMSELQPRNTTAPDFLFIDVILLAYRLGYVRHPEQKVSLLSAARMATDAFSFLTAMEDVGIGRRSQLYGFAGKVLAAPAYYRAQYPKMLGLRREGEEAEGFLRNQLVLFLVEGVLTIKQQDVFYDAYWWFTHNHEPVFTDPKRGHCIGVYATDPQDNASTLERFEEFLLRQVNHKSKYIRERFEGFPADIVIAILRRAFL